MRMVERKEDMSPDGKLVLIQQADGDIIINVRTGSDSLDYIPMGLSVEFCEISCGGGRSPHTIKALKKLMEAIELDNQETPLQG